MKKTGITILTAIFLFSIILLGGPTSSNAEPIELSFNHTVPPMIPIAKLAQAWGKRIEEQSGGKVKFSYHWASSLVAQQEIFKSAQTGVVDVSYYPLSANFQPLSYYAYLPLMGFTSMSQGTEIYNKIYEKFPEIRDEYKGVKMLAARMGPPAQIHTTKKAVEIPADLKGLKIGTVGREMAELLKASGAAPIMGGAVADTYMNLERGVTDGIINHFPLVLVFGTMPLLKNHTMFGEGSGIGGNIDSLIMNLERFNNFSPDIQKIIMDASAWYKEEINKIDVGFIKTAEGAAKKMNHNFTYIDTPEKLKPWQDIVKPIHDDWIKRMEKKGKPGKAVYEAVKNMLD